MAGATGATGSPGPASTGVTSSVTIVPPTVGANAKPVAEATIGSGSTALTFPVLTAELAGVATPQAVSAKTKFHDLNITKALDIASPKLLGLAAAGKHIPKVTIEYATLSRAGKHLEITLSDVAISSDETQARKGKGKGKDGLVSESISLSYQTIESKYINSKRSD